MNVLLKLSLTRNYFIFCFISLFFFLLSFQLPPSVSMGNKESVEFSANAVETTGSRNSSTILPSSSHQHHHHQQNPPGTVQDEEEPDVELPPPMPLVSTATASAAGQQHSSGSGSTPDSCAANATASVSPGPSSQLLHSQVCLSVSLYYHFLSTLVA